MNFSGTLPVKQMLMDKITPLAILLASYWSLGGSDTVTQQGYLYTNLGLNDVEFQDNVTFESTASNAGECALHCNKLTNCLTFTFHGSTCRGHPIRMMPNATSSVAPGARSFAREANDTEPADEPGVVKCKETGVKRVTDASLGLDMDVYCEGEWLVFQKRRNGRVDFFRNWQSYSEGFGYVEGCSGYWMGLEPLHRITAAGVTYELRIDLVKWDGTATYGLYSNFSISSEADNYRLNFDSKLEGTLDDSLDTNRGLGFSTLDVKNDLALSNESCALGSTGGWWFSDCGQVNLNGMYLNKYSTSMKGIIWNAYDSKRSTQMMIKPTE